MGTEAAGMSLECPARLAAGKKLPGGSGESTGQRAPAWGNRISRSGSGNGERERESPFAKLEGAEPRKFICVATFFRRFGKNPIETPQAAESQSILFWELICQILLTIGMQRVLPRSACKIAQLPIPFVQIA
jgi:hypothetical protein